MQNIETKKIDTRYAHDGTQAVSSDASKVLKNTYLLLAATLFVSALTAGISVALQLPHPGIVITLIGYFGLLFLTNKFRNDARGILCVFALTGFMGFTLGPIVGAYWSMAPAVVMQAFAGTALVFFGMSGIALTSKRDFSFLGQTLFIGILIAFVAGLAAIFFEISALSLAVSAMFVLLMSGLILFETNQIVRGGETNYIMATVTLFVSIFNLFSSLLHLLGFMQGE